MVLKYEKSKHEVYLSLVTQCRLLLLAIQAYDHGHQVATLWMANGIYTICSDRGKSHKSIIKSLGKKQLSYVRSTSVRGINERNIIPQALLAKISIKEDQISYTPREIGHISRDEFGKLSIENWLNEKILKNSGQNELSRLDLVKWMRDTLGGAHVDADPKNKNAFFHLHTSQVAEFVNSSGEEIRPTVVGEVASMRQIAHELLYSLCEQTELFDLSGYFNYVDSIESNR